MNGTHVNGAKFGARQKGETPEQGAKRRYPEVTLKHGDRIKVGRTELEVSIEQPKEAPLPRVVKIPESEARQLVGDAPLEVSPAKPGPVTPQR